MGSPVQSSCITQGAELEGCLSSPMAQQSSICLPMRETRVRSLGWEDPLEEEMATYSSILARKMLWTGESGGLQSTGLQRVGHDWATKQQLCPQPLPGLKTGIHVGPFSWFLSTVILVGVGTLMTVLGACGDQGGPCEVTPEVPWQQGCCSHIPAPCPSCHWEGNP